MSLSRRKLPEGLAIASQSAEFWRRLAPELTISDAQPARQVARDVDRGRADRMRLVNDGFLHLKGHGLDAPFDRIATALERIVSAGFPASFIGVYDEVWSLAAQMGGVMDGIFAGKSALVPVFWASHAGADDTGASAGRRRGGASLFGDGTPKTVSLWLPLTRATADNGCVYVVPAGQDRNYGKPGTTRADSSLTGIRALPADPGDALIWTGETYHWRGRPDRNNADGALLSLSFEFQSRDCGAVEGLVIDSYPYVPFETRLALLARQIPRYGGIFTRHPVWRAVQQTLANRYPMRQARVRV
jgi:hypothetical protein